MNKNQSLWKVINLYKDAQTKIVVSNLKTKRSKTIFLNRFVYINFNKSEDHQIHRQDILKISYKGKKIKEIVKILDDGFGRKTYAKVYPYYSRGKKLNISKNLHLTLEIKEITSSEEFDHIRSLSQFHYLGKDNLWGRKHYLLVKATDEQNHLPPILGYIMLTSSSLLSRQRDKILGWKTIEQRKSNIDRIVRITRVVVHPEFRGIGLGQLLVHHAIMYCKDYWKSPDNHYSI